MLPEVGVTVLGRCSLYLPNIIRIYLEYIMLALTKRSAFELRVSCVTSLLESKGRNVFFLLRDLRLCDFISKCFLEAWAMVLSHEDGSLESFLTAKPSGWES